MRPSASEITLRPSTLSTTSLCAHKTRNQNGFTRVKFSADCRSRREPRRANVGRHVCAHESPQAVVDEFLWLTCSNFILLTSVGLISPTVTLCPFGCAGTSLDECVEFELKVSEVQDCCLCVSKQCRLRPSGAECSSQASRVATPTITWKTLFACNHETLMLWQPWPSSPRHSEQNPTFLATRCCCCSRSR